MEEVYVARDGYIKPTWMYLRRLLEERPDINDVLNITLNSYDI